MDRQWRTEKSECRQENYKAASNRQFEEKDCPFDRGLSLADASGAYHVLLIH